MSWVRINDERKAMGIYRQGDRTGAYQVAVGPGHRRLVAVGGPSSTLTEAYGQALEFLAHRVHQLDTALSLYEQGLKDAS